MAAPKKQDRVLVADSDASERTRLATVVRAAATACGRTVEVMEATSGTSALEQWTAQPPSLVICEVLLEGISGLSLLRRMKAEPTPLPPVIFVTRLARESDRYWGLRNGAHAYIPKPFDDQLLQGRVKELLEKGADASRQRPLD